MRGGGIPASEQREEHIPFDSYFIAEGGWSDSTRRLGFTKIVHKANPRFGLVVNMKYDPEVKEERALRRRIWHALGAECEHTRL